MRNPGNDEVIQMDYVKHGPVVRNLGDDDVIYVYEGCSKSKVTFQFSPATYIQVLNFCCCCVGTLVTIIRSQF